MGALLTAVVTRSQSQSLRHIGYLTLNAITPADPGLILWKELEDALAKMGYREGASLLVERRHAAGDVARLKEAALDLVKSNVEVIVAIGSQNVKAAADATSSVPIVSYTADPVTLGFARSYARPGRNVTGVSPSTTDLSPKQLELLASAVPGLRRVAWLRNSSNPYFSASFAERINEAAATLHIAATPIDVVTAEALEPSIKEIARKGFGGVLVPSDVLYLRLRDRLATSLLAHRLPSATLDAVMLDAGLLLSYGIDFVDGIRRMARQIDKIFKGVRPGEIPIDIIERFSLGLNLRTARALGIRIPQSLLLRADRVIE